MITNNFSLKKYRSLINALLDKKYRFITLSKYFNGGCGDKFVILRHDVDRLPQNALRIARLEHSLGVCSSFYFRNVDGAFEEDIIREIASLGHEVGYHYEDFSSCNGDLSKAYRQFVHNLNLLRTIAPVKTIAMHGSPTSGFDNRLLWLFFDFKGLGILGEAYISPDYNDIAYISDTSGRWNDTRFSVRDKTENEINMPYFKSTSCIVKAVQNSSFPKKAVILSHPQRWSDSPVFLLADGVRQNLKNIVKYFINRHVCLNTISFDELKKKIDAFVARDIENTLLLNCCENINESLLSVNNRLAVSDRFLFWARIDGKMSKAEFLGRLYYCGFAVDAVECYNNFCFAFASKSRSVLSAPEIHYGAVVKLPRIGLNGNVFEVHKLRTMYPYSEFLQDYFSKNVPLKKGGKYADDFRIMKGRRWMRRIWIDELPNLYNLIKGDMKLVGVRPLSKSYYDLYDDDLKIARIKYKPGLLPPFYADNPVSLADIQNSERIYLKTIQTKGLKKTDWYYFKIIVGNILFNHRRSA